MNFLIVDYDFDRLAELELLLRGLSSANSVSGAESLQEANHLLMKRRFGCCFFSLDWGGASGFMLLSEFSSSPALGRMPLIAYGVEPTKENVVGLIEAGGTGFLVSPFTLDAVKSVVKSLPSRENAAVG